jgi:hypothetical protein
MALNPVTMDTMPSAQLNIGWASALVFQLFWEFF